MRRGLSWGAVTSTAFLNVMSDNLLTQLDKGKNVKAVLFVDDTILWTPLLKCQEYQFSRNGMKHLLLVPI